MRPPRPRAQRFPPATRLTGRSLVIAPGAGGPPEPTVPPADPPRAGCRPQLPHRLSRQANPPCFPTLWCPYTRVGSVRIRSAAWGRHKCVPEPCVAERARGGPAAAARHDRNAKLATPCLLGESCGRRPEGRSLRPVAVFGPVRPWSFCPLPSEPKGGLASLAPSVRLALRTCRRLRLIPFMKNCAFPPESKAAHGSGKAPGELAQSVSDPWRAGGTVRSGAGASTPGRALRLLPVRRLSRCCRCERG